MKPINVEITMGHSIGVSASYYKPKEREVMEDYLKAADSLTINSDKVVLQKQVAELKEKSKESQYIAKQLTEKDEEMKTLRSRYDSDIALLKDTVSDMQQLLKNPKKLSEIASYLSG